MAKKRRNYTPVRPSPELIAHIEELVLDYLRTHNERAYWTYLLVMLGRTLSERRKPLDREWVNLSSYGHSKVLGRVMDSLIDRSIVTRKKNFHPYILTNVLDRIVKEMDKARET